MMSERTELVKARREAEDNLVKTIIQLSSALVVLMAGFIAQSKIDLSGWSFCLFVATIIFLIVSLSAGLIEHFWSSKAYQEQQILVEKYFTKVIDKFEEPTANRWVRAAQFVALGSFLLALALTGAFAFVQAGIHRNDEPSASSSASAASAASASSAAAAAAAATDR